MARSSLHGRKSKNQDYGELGSRVHIEFPNYENRQDAECPIRPAGDSRIRIGRFEDDACINAMAFHAGILTPKVCDGPALENEEEEKVSGHDG
jgi:hypothetical protein